MGLEFLADDYRFVSGAAGTATWAGILAHQAIRKRFRGLFVLSGVATTFMGYDAAMQFNAHIEYYKARTTNRDITEQKVALIAQTQALVPISEQAHLLQINRIRSLLSHGLIPILVTVNDKSALDANLRKQNQNQNDIKLFWLRSNLSQHTLQLSYGEVVPLHTLRPYLLELKCPIMIETQTGDIIHTQFTKPEKGPQPATLVTGEDAIEAVLTDFKYRKTMKFETSSIYYKI